MKHKKKDIEEANYYATNHAPVLHAATAYNAFLAACNEKNHQVRELLEGLRYAQLFLDKDRCDMKYIDGLIKTHES